MAQSWSASKDGLAYDFVIRKAAKFHNGDPVTADDVKFSFERYRGAGAKILKDRVREIQVVDAEHVRFRLKEPWPDFLTFYATPATGGQRDPARNEVPMTMRSNATLASRGNETPASAVAPNTTGGRHRRCDRHNNTPKAATDHAP